MKGTRIFEFPISTTLWFGKRLCFFGGGYFRFFPYKVIAAKIQELNIRGIPVIFYIHPKDLDPNQPRLPMPLKRRFKSYIGLNNSETKLRRLLLDFQFGSISDFLQNTESAQRFFENAYDPPF